MNYKIGDIVKIIGNAGQPEHYYTLGDQCEIEGVNTDDLYLRRLGDDPLHQMVSVADVVKVEEPRFKKGQKVRVTGGRWFPEGTICTIMENDTLPLLLTGMDNFGKQAAWYVSEHNFELLLDEYDTRGGEKTMATNFKVGDKLELIDPRKSCGCVLLKTSFSNKITDYIILTNTNSDWENTEEKWWSWDAYKGEKRNDLSNCCAIDLSNFRKVSSANGNFMTKLTNIAKRLLDADTKALVKAGVLDSELQITEEGKQFLLAQYLIDNKPALAKEAQKIVDAQEKECK